MLPDINLSWIKTLSLIHAERKDPSVQSPVHWPFHSTLSLQKAQYVRMLEDSIWGRFYSLDSLDHQIPGCGKWVPITLQASRKAVAIASWSPGFSGLYYPAREAQDVSTPVAIKNSTILCGGCSSMPVLSSEDYKESIRLSLQDKNLLTGGSTSASP